MKFWARKAIECSKLGELFCGSLGGKNVETQMMEARLVTVQQEVWESLKDSIRAIYYFEFRIHGSGYLELKSNLGVVY